jgi:hypothetical protein
MSAVVDAGRHRRGQGCSRALDKKPPKRRHPSAQPQNGAGGLDAALTKCRHMPPKKTDFDRRSHRATAIQAEP